MARARAEGAQNGRSVIIAASSMVACSYVAVGECVVFCEECGNVRGATKRHGETETDTGARCDAPETSLVDGRQTRVDRVP